MRKGITSIFPPHSQPATTALTIPSLDAIDTSLTLPDLVASFVPTPRFATVSFDNYVPVPSEPSQAQARDTLRQFVGDVVQRGRSARGNLWPRVLGIGPRPRGMTRGIYLDGGFGVGKTHLLAAAYHAAPVSKVYLSFAELTYTIAQMGLTESIAEFRTYDLICLDEFELDDIASTRMAATFLQQVMEEPGGAHLITTSNTPPRESGRGRFAADEFRREIGQIAARFDVVRIEGDDYRLRSFPTAPDHALAASAAELQARFMAYVPPTGAKLLTGHAALLDSLARLHPIRYARLLQPLGTLFVEGLAPIAEQDQALRFVHLIDKLYDLRVGFAASATCALPEIFAPDYRDRGYAKKYRRCLSRLHELLGETSIEG